MSPIGAERADAPGPRSASPLRLLTDLCAALAHGDHDAARDLLTSGRVDWPGLRAIADEHRLTGYLSAQLQTQGLATVVPPEFLHHARHVYLQQWIRNGQLFREMERIAARLEAGGLPHLFFKGPLLAHTLYAQLGSRAVHDIDLLIPRRATPASYEPALATLGYHRRSRLLLPLSLSRYWLYQLEYSSDTCVLEPHWALQRHPFLVLDHERIWHEREMRRTPSGTALPALSDEYTLLANILSIPADLQNAALKLRTLFELHLLWRRFPATYDWASFWERRRAERTRRLTGIVRAVVGDLFAPAEPAEPPSVPLPETDRRLVAELGAHVLGAGTSASHPRRLALRLFDAPLPVSLAWWALTLPARALAHPTVTMTRLRRW